MARTYSEVPFQTAMRIREDVWNILHEGTIRISHTRPNDGPGEGELKHDIPMVDMVEFLAEMFYDAAHHLIVSSPDDESRKESSAYVRALSHWMGDPRDERVPD